VRDSRSHETFVCYHTTAQDRDSSILTKGLRPNSRPMWFSNPTPYVMLSVKPRWDLNGKESVVLGVRDPRIRVEYFDDPEGLRWPHHIDSAFLKRTLGIQRVESHGLNKSKEILMLSPKAELRALVRSVAEPSKSELGDHLSLRKIRGLLARTIRATLACVDVREDRSRTVALALLDLDISSGVERTGV